MKPANTAAAPTEEASRQRFMSVMGEQLSGVYEYVRHALAAREAAGDLEPGDLTPEDVVDDVILRAYREFGRNPEEQHSDDWLRRLAKDRIRAEVRRLRWERERSIHIEEDIPETPPVEEAAMLGEEILYFYQPDEDLKVEDVVQDPTAPVPGEDDERRELRRCVDLALTELPRQMAAGACAPAPERARYRADRPCLAPARGEGQAHGGARERLPSATAARERLQNPRGEELSMRFERLRIAARP